MRREVGPIISHNRRWRRVVTVHYTSSVADQYKSWPKNL